METRLIVNPLDYASDAYGIVRFLNETDENFKNRLRGFIRRDPTHTYRGLVEAASLEVGIPILPFIDISSTIPSSYMEVTPTGFVCSNDVETLISSHFTLDVSGNWEIVSGFAPLTSAVSGSSTFSIDQPITYYNVNFPTYTSPYVVLRFNPINLLQSTNEKRMSETHSSYKYCIKLEYVPLRGSVVLNYADTSLYTEVAALSDVVRVGHYYIDYDTGTIYFYGYGEFQDEDYDLYDILQIDYMYREVPFRLYLVPIQMFSFIDPNLQPFMYNVYDNQVNTWDRVEFPMVTDIINEIRTQNVNY